MIQLSLLYVCLQTLKYSETHRSGGHFDVEINQRTSKPAQQRYKVTFQVTHAITPLQNSWWGFIATLIRPMKPYVLQSRQRFNESKNKRQQRFQLTLALRYVNKLLCQRVMGQFNLTPLTNNRLDKDTELPEGVLHCLPLPHLLVVHQYERHSCKRGTTLACVRLLLLFSNVDNKLTLDS